jgi:putative ABC transport system permease protein
MGTTLQDLKYALRMLVKNPGFAAVAVLTLALGIGANTAIFSVVDAVLLRPLPFPQPERIFAVHQSMPEKGIPKSGASYPNFLDWTRQNKSFEELAAMRDTTMALSGQGQAIFVETAGVTGGYFGVFEQKPLLGRTLQETDDMPSADAVVVISEALWRSRFGSDPKILGEDMGASRAERYFRANARASRRTLPRNYWPAETRRHASAGASGDGLDPGRPPNAISRRQ